MIVRNEQEALCVAVEMERRAIRTYERALLVASDAAVRRGIEAILSDEREHLRRFSEMKAACPIADHEERLLIQAMAADTLFPGGVMEMERAHGLNSLHDLYAFAADSEQDAVNNYSEFAKKCIAAPVAQAFRAIAREEATHLAALKQALGVIDGNDEAGG